MHTGPAVNNAPPRMFDPVDFSWPTPAGAGAGAMIDVTITKKTMRAMATLQPQAPQTQVCRLVGGGAYALQLVFTHGHVLVQAP